MNYDKETLQWLRQRTLENVAAWFSDGLEAVQEGCAFQVPRRVRRILIRYGLIERAATRRDGYILTKLGEQMLKEMKKWR